MNTPQSKFPAARRTPQNASRKEVLHCHWPFLIGFILFGFNSLAEPVELDWTVLFMSPVILNSII
jgi:hypothetical protein